MIAVQCAVPNVMNGTVSCRSPGGMATDSPTHGDICTASCDVGYWPNYDVTTCIVSGDSGAFDNELACEGRYKLKIK